MGLRVLEHALMEMWLGFAGAEATWGRLDKQALEACLDLVALSLAVVMAGTGHLPTFKLLRGIFHDHKTDVAPCIRP